MTHSTPNESTPAADASSHARQCPGCGTPLKADLPEGLCPVCLLQRGLSSNEDAPGGKTPFVPPTLAELAQLFPQLEILEMIGQGGMGAVYKARQPSLDRLVALKILARPGSDLDFASRFTQEARALARLNHPNIVSVYDFGQVGNLNYLLMEFVGGPNLRQVQQAGKLTPPQALQIIPQICAALQFAHDEAIVHRDIKPENVLLDKKGRVKIADFGLAKILGHEPKDFRLTGARDIVGTPHYMAPEQVEKPQEVDHRADIYSLGVVFYEMLTGELPLGRFQPPSSKVEIDVRLDEVVLRTLEKEPARRYQHVSEVKTRVETIAAVGPPPGAASSTNANPDKSFRKGAILAALMVLAVLGGILGLWALRNATTRQRVGLVASWSAEGNARDAAGVNDGILMEGVTFGPGVKGKGFQFDGRGGGIVIPASASLNVGTNNGLTIEAWVKPEDVERLNPVLEWNDGPGVNYGLHLALAHPDFGTGNFYVNIIGSNGSRDWHVIKSPPHLIIPGTFQQIALTYDRHSGMAALYHNGLQVTVKNIGQFTPQTSYNLYIGLRPPGDANSCSFNGGLDEISILNRVLSPAEVSSDYKNGKLGL